MGRREGEGEGGRRGKGERSVKWTEGRRSENE